MFYFVHDKIADTFSYLCAILFGETRKLIRFRIFLNVRII